MQAATQTMTTRKKQPVRTCVGCRAEDQSSHLVRVVLGPDGEVFVDLAGRAFGRGAWVHATPKCIGQAAPRGLSRSFKTRVTTTAAELSHGMAQAAERRATSLILAARAAGKLAVGTDAVEAALGNGTARLVVVATDARAVAKRHAVQQAVSDGRAVAHGTKERLGALLNRAETGVLAVLDAGIATTLSQTIAMIHMPEPEVREVHRTDASREDG